MKPFLFTKMHGLGNDFIVVDGINQALHFTANDIQQLAARHTGIGFDQCLIVEKSNHPEIDFFYRIFNANGQEVGQCGNGARCLALFLKQYGLTNKEKINIATQTTRMQLTIHANNTVTINMGIPQFSPGKIPLKVAEQSQLYAVELLGKSYHFHALNVGNPHAVLVVSNLSSAPVETIGKLISEHSLFPEQTNTGFMEIQNPAKLLLRVYERGCGETQACGSGAVAAAAVGRLYYDMAETIEVNLPGGSLTVSWRMPQESIFLTGPATFVFEGKYC